MSHSHGGGNKYVYLLQEFSIPLLLGVVVALIVANVSPGLYDKLVNHTYAFVVGDAEDEHDEHGDEHGDDHSASDDQHADDSTDGHEEDEELFLEAGHGGDHHHDWRHFATMHFVINELFMVLFFGIAAKEIAESCLPGGALNPPSKAINPLLGTLGGVFGPVGVYLFLNYIMGDANWTIGWGIPTATDIALAWLIARIVFGTGHPAISFLLLLAVADDGIGLIIIAIFYPTQSPEWLQALWIIPGMLAAYGLRRMNVQSWLPYIAIGGALSWYGLYAAHLHPALALVPIVPLLPGPKRDEGLFRDDPKTHESDPLNKFEHDLKSFVDFGLFFFAFANAGVQFSSLSNLTWIVLLSLLVGKTLGITLFSWVGTLIGFPMPTGMKLKHLVVAGVIAGLGLTVALFVAGQAFSDNNLQGAAKMGALFSGGIAFLAIVMGRMMGVKDGAGSASSKSGASAGH